MPMHSLCSYQLYSFDCGIAIAIASFARAHRTRAYCTKHTGTCYEHALPAHLYGATRSKVGGSQKRVVVVLCKKYAFRLSECRSIARSLCANAHQ